MLPSLITSIVPDAVSVKRVCVELSGSVFVPIVSSTAPRIAISGSSGVSPKSPPACRLTPPESAMKKTRLPEEPPPVALCSWSISLKLSLPAVPRLPAVSAHEPATNETVTPPGANCPLMK